MARYPKAVWKPVTRYAKGGANHVLMDAPRRLVYHTAVYGGDSLFDLFNTPGNPVAHFYIREDGTVEQYVDTGVRASAVLEGNHDCLTVESWDGGKVVKWTPEQVEACAQLAVWCHDKHGIKLQRLPSSLPGTQGVGWHRLGIDGNFPQTPGRLLGGRVSNGEHWSTSAGKVCPGDPKIHGVVEDILPRAIELASGDAMSAADVKAINDNTDAGIQRLAELVNARAKAERVRDAATADKVIAAVKAQVMTGGLDEAALEAAIRNVFGSLDEGETP